MPLPFDAVFARSVAMGEVPKHEGNTRGGEGKIMPGKINYGKIFVRNFGTVFLPGF